LLAAAGRPADRTQRQGGARVLIVVQNSSVPFDRRVWNESRALREAGYDVTVISARGEDRDNAPHEVIEGVDIWRFPVRSALGGLDYGREYAVSLRQIRRLARQLAVEPFDVVHICNPPDVLVFAVLSLRRRGARVVFDQHDVVPELFVSRFGESAAGPAHRPIGVVLRALEAITYRLSDTVLATNESYRHIAITRGGVAPDRVHVVRNGPDLNRFVPLTPDPGLKRGRKHLACYLGVMGVQDGVDRAVRALAVLFNDLGRDDLHAAFIGWGDAAEDCRQLAADLGIADRVEFTGRVPDEVVQRYLSTADLCLAPDPPSPLNNVSTMTKVMEYLAMGNPVVSFDLPETRVSAGDAAVYAHGDDVREFAQLIAELLDDPERRARMAAEGRDRVERELSWNVSRQRLLVAYQSTLSTPQRYRSGRRSGKSAEAAGSPVEVGSRRVPASRNAPDVDVVVIGAGPYGLGCAAALERRGVQHRVFGRPMSFWAENMPAGMLLRSPYVASSIGSPDPIWGLDEFAAARGSELGERVPLERFVEYGRWFQQQAAPALDRRSVRSLERQDGNFKLLLEGDSVVRARQVVVATGIGPFARRPAVASNLPPERVSHTSEVAVPERFRGQRVAIVGAGQSALEYTALLVEAGADVHLMVRDEGVRWLRRHPRLHTVKPVAKMLYAPAEIGPPGLCRLAEAPDAFRHIPSPTRQNLTQRCIRPAGSAWLRDRVVGKADIRCGVAVISVGESPDGVALSLSDGSTLEVDHLVLATGYRIDISRYSFLGADLLGSVRQADGSPILSRHFESSCPGLYFVGAPAGWSFGPLMRFVAGTGFAADRVATALVRGVAAAS
jgi:glycosyltransferase involved in cell wall biosynthesis